jgi:hypothetical protein
MGFMGIDECVHLENDIMVYFNLDEMLHRLRSAVGKKFAATYLGGQQLTYATLYIGDLFSFSQLTTYLVSQKSSENEMSLGYTFYTENPEYCAFLPTYPVDNGVIESYIGAERFKGVWDAAAYGQYIGGIDPRNGEGGPGFVNQNCAFRSDEFTYSWSSEGGLKYPVISKGRLSWPLYNLHIHSKELAKYKST